MARSEVENYKWVQSRTGLGWKLPQTKGISATIKTGKYLITGENWWKEILKQALCFLSVIFEPNKKAVAQKKTPVDEVMPTESWMIARWNINWENTEQFQRLTG